MQTGIKEKEHKMDAFNSFMQQPWVPVALMAVIVIVIVIIKIFRSGKK